MSKDSLFETQEQPVATATGEERFGNGFEVEALVGSGRASVLFRARERASGRIVALKVLSPLDHETADRFLVEAAVLTKLAHPAIARHIAYGLTPQRRPYLAVDWLDGANLGQRLAYGRLAPDVVARLGARVLQALATAHREGLIHGDLKPSNLFLPDRDPARVVVLDVGVGLCRPRAQPPIHNALTGPWYLAPEQLQDCGALDGRADIFSLGSVLYECATGNCLQPEAPWKTPFPVEGFADRCAVVPQPLRAILERMLAPDAANRPDDPEGLCSELLEVARVLEGIGTRFAIAVSPLGDLRVLFQKGPREAPHTLAGRTVPFFGRERELDLLEGVWHEVCDQSVARAIIVSAPAGVGKTRLRQELCERIKQHGPAFELLVGGGDPMLDGAPLSLIGPAIMASAGLTCGEPEQVKRQRLVAEVEHFLPPGQATRVAAFLGEMAGIPCLVDLPILKATRTNPRLMSDQMRMAWLDWIEAICSRHPVLLVLEDLQWGDGASVAFVETMLRVFRDRPLMVMALAQPEVDQRFTSLWREHAPQRIHLSPLSPRQAQRMIEYLAGPLPAPELREILERAQGNPLCLGEWVRVVLSGGKVTSRPPDTAMGMIRTRLQTLDHESRLALGACSVLGRCFHAQAVRAVVDNDGDLDVEHCLSLLEGQEILFSFQSTIGREFVFRHPLVRQAAYDMLPSEERRLGHLWAGRFIEQLGESDACILAEHFERSRDKSRAVHWLKRAARQALHADDTTGTVALVARALKQGTSDEDERALRLTEAELHLWHEEYSEAERAARAAASSLASETRWSANSNLLAALSAQSKSEDMARILVRIEDRPEHPELIGYWLECLLNAAPFLVTSEGARFRKRIITALNGLEEEARADPHLAGGAASLQAQLVEAAGEPTRAQAGFVRAADHYASMGNRRAECEARARLGQLLLKTGQLDKAEDCLRPLLYTAQRMELTPLLGRIAALLARALAYRGAGNEARDLGHRALAVAGLRRDRQAQGEAEACLSMVEFLSGHYLRAEKFARGGAASFERESMSQSFAQCLLARALLAQGRTGEALQYARAAHARRAPPCRIDGNEGTLHLAMAECLLATGEADFARKVLRRAADNLEDLADTITEPNTRRSYLTELPEHSRLLQLCRQVGLEPWSTS